MKKKGAVMEFSAERIEDLMSVYRSYIRQCDFIRMPDVYENIVNMPAKRFYVSDIRAALVVASIQRGENVLKEMRESKRKMFKEIYNRVIALKDKEPKLSLSQLCAIVVSQPAPEFYLTPGTAKVMICKERRKWKKKHRKSQL